MITDQTEKQDFYNTFTALVQKLNNGSLAIMASPLEYLKQWPHHLDLRVSRSQTMATRSWSKGSSSNEQQFNGLTSVLQGMSSNGLRTFVFSDATMATRLLCAVASGPELSLAVASDELHWALASFPHVQWPNLACWISIGQTLACTFTTLRKALHILCSWRAKLNIRKKPLTACAHQWSQIIR